MGDQAVLSKRDSEKISLSGPIPKEPWKLLIAIGFAVGGGFASFLGLALTHDRVPREAASLPDFVLDNVIYQQRAIVWCERILAASSVMGGIVVLFHKHRSTHIFSHYNVCCPVAKLSVS